MQTALCFIGSILLPVLALLCLVALPDLQTPLKFALDVIIPAMVFAVICLPIALLMYAASRK